MFEDKTVFITGAASGIGRVTALAFARTGARLALADLSAEALEETGHLVREAGSRVRCDVLDVTRREDVDRVIDAVVAEWGGLDCAFNNAGVTLEGIGHRWGDVEAFDRSMDINARGVLYCMQAELRHMSAQGRGAIVNTASIAGESGAGGAGYCASKHAVVGLTRSAALAFASRGVRVNAVCPGVIETPMTAAMVENPQSAQLIGGMVPMGRFGRAEEIASAVLFLCSDQASFITGHPLAVDGGFLAR